MMAGSAPSALRAPAFRVAAFTAGAAVLYFAKPLLMPIALAVLVSFWLAPLVSRIERTGLGRVVAVILVCVVVAGATGGLAWLVDRQAVELSGQLPEYRRNLVSKVRALRGPLGSLARAAVVMDELESELDGPAKKSEAPPKVEVVERSNPIETVTSVATPLVEPLGIAAAVAVLVVFMLLQREDLRDRVIRLAGSRDLTLTTHAIDDASRRLSRILGTQSLLCAAHGTLVGVGLAAIGIPGAAMWGVLAALLRFIPYVGPFISVSLPVAIALAAFPGWTPVVEVLLLFLVLELLSSNALEPWLYGMRTGLSPFAVVLSAFFWTWLWGIPGLFLAMPLTICLVVAGRYVESLEGFRILFGDEAALEPEVRFYQRMLSIDAGEVEMLLRRTIETEGIQAASDGLVLPALRWFARDVDRGSVPRDRARRIRSMLVDLFEELPSTDAEERGAARVFLRPGRDEPESIAGAWLSRLLKAHGFVVRADGRLGGPAQQADPREVVPDVICVPALTPESALSARRICRQLRLREPRARIFVAFWSEGRTLVGDARPSTEPAGVAWVASASELARAIDAAVPALPKVATAG